MSIEKALLDEALLHRMLLVCDIVAFTYVHNEQGHLAVIHSTRHSNQDAYRTLRAVVAAPTKITYFVYDANEGGVTIDEVTPSKEGAH